MNAAPSDPKPTALEVLRRRKNTGEELTIIENCVLSAKDEFAACELTELYQDRSDLAAAQKRYEAAEAERDELANWIKRIHGQAEAAEAVIHGQKSEVNLEVAPTA